MLNYLESNSKNGFWWTVLGGLYLEKFGKATQASFSFSQSGKLRGKHDTIVKEWSFLGPFVIGKMELDGDPMEAFGGIKNVSQYRYSNVNYYSELAEQGKVSWTVVKQPSQDEYLKITPPVQWNQLVNSLGSMAITEWQGWLVGEFVVNDKNAHIAVQCLGVHTFSIDDTLMTGDVYHRDRFWTTKYLSQGVHTIYIKLRTKVSGNFKCTLRTVKAGDLVDILTPHFVPDLYEGYLFSNYIAVPVGNYNSKKSIIISKVRTVEQSGGETINSELLNEVTIAPGQTYPMTVKLSSENTSKKIIKDCSMVKLYFKLLTSEGSIKFKVDLRCRKRSESFLFTFLDHDGSIQHAAAIAPVQSCMDNGACPVVLTLHGTTVPPQNQADSYKHMVDGEFVFGYDHAWVLAPTRYM